MVTLILVFLGLQYRLWIGEGSFAERHRIEKRRDALAAANAKARERNQAMQAEVDDLKAGDGAAEARAREEMGMVKPGETFFLTVPDGAQPENGSQRRTPADPASN
ncbi:septum formation initiator family protein [uncultured Salinisphaera sp.]|uniref:septum formation initiator family protein n=1 Tax=uncultured Salinisphaera sp. TaxID=359372 RepID=UPI0032B205D3